MLLRVDSCAEGTPTLEHGLSSCRTTGRYTSTCGHLHGWPCMQSAMQQTAFGFDHHHAVDLWHSSCNESEAAKPARKETDMQSSDRTQASARQGEATSPLIDKPHAARLGGHACLFVLACTSCICMGKLESRSSFFRSCVLALACMGRTYNRAVLWGCVEARLAQTERSLH
jgi:hypothetical protein